MDCDRPLTLTTIVPMGTTSPMCRFGLSVLDTYRLDCLLDIMLMSEVTNAELF